MELTFKSKLWEWQGQGAWCFISVPKEYYADIQRISQSPRKGFGSVRVEVLIGKTSWKTSIFPDSKSGTYLLPVKKSVREEENINIGDLIAVEIRLIDF